MKAIELILVSHWKYIDICEDFIKLFKKNWPNCPYNLTISIKGKKKINYDKVIYNSDNCSLPKCIYNVVRQSNSKYFFCFLGDAFFSRKIDNNQVKNLVNSIKLNSIEYCCLIPRMPYLFTKKSIDSYIRKINYWDRYNVSFIAFVASKEFISNKFSGNISDYEFENSYIYNSFTYSKAYYYSCYAIVQKNIFHIVPAIEKGKWNIIGLLKLKCLNPKIIFSKRHTMSIYEMIYAIVSKVSRPLLSPNFRNRTRL